MGVQLGAVTPVFYAFRDREYVLNQIEAATGGRFHPNFDRIGGLKDDLPKGWIDETQPVMKQDALVLRRDGGPAPRQRDLPDPHPRHRRHPAGGRAPVRPVRRQPARQRRRLGPAPRPALPMAWDKVDWKVWTHPDGDSFARYWVRLQEIREATQDRRPAARRPAEPGRSWPRCRASSRCPRARPGSRTENPLGEMGYYVVSKGDTRPVPGEDPLGQLQQHLDRAVGAAGVYVPDVITILASLYFILGDIDRDDCSPVAVDPLLGPVAPARRSVCTSPCCCPPARSSTCSCSR